MKGKKINEFIKPRTGEVLSFRTKSYYIYPDGRVWNNEKRRFVKQYENYYGYIAVDLCGDDGKRNKNIGVHRLVASVFQRLLCKGEVVHHIDHDKNNNNLSNLEIISASEHQRQHSLENWENGTMGGVAEKLRNVGNSYNQAKQVAQIDKDGHLIRVWPSTMEASRNGYHLGNVSECCNGKRNFHKGYVWQWYDEYLSSQPTAQQQWEARQLHLAF